jgi:lysozyme
VNYVITDETVNLIKRFEGLKLKSYKDIGGVWTIGYGITTSAGIGILVGPGMEITKETAEEHLILCLKKFAEKMYPMFTTNIPTPNQFGAMLSLAYNIGLGAFGTSTCLKRFNAGDVHGAAEALQWFNKVGKRKVRGLVNRRAAEAALMLSEATIETPKADPVRDSVASSSTMKSAGTWLLGSLGGVGTAIGSLDGTAQLIVVGACAVGGLLALWIIRERLQKWADGDR